MKCEENFITMKLIWHSYILSSLSSCAYETSTETGLISCLVGVHMWCAQIIVTSFFSFLNFFPLHLHLVFSFSFLFQYFVYLFICVFEIFIWQIFHIKYTKKLSWEVVISTNYMANLCIKVVWEFFLITCT